MIGPPTGRYGWVVELSEHDLRLGPWTRLLNEAGRRLDGDAFARVRAQLDALAARRA